MARPSRSLELRISARQHADGVQLLILDLDEEAGDVSVHDSVEQAKHWAADQTGLQDIAWTAGA